jgi:uncharacterized protein involved in exopolysaccharide biosynthesis
MKMPTTAKPIYTITVEVDIDALTKTYLEGSDATQPDTLSSMIEYECNWLQSSGLSVKDISSLDDNNGMLPSRS